MRITAIRTRRIALPLPCDALPMFGETRAQVARAGPRRGVACGHHDIHGRQRMLIQSERLACQALDEVARDGRAQGARGDRQSQARMSFMVGKYGQGKICVGDSPATLPYHAKFGRLVQALVRFERQPSRTRVASCRQGQRRLRPFARRRDRTCRPLLVAMRARNPCVRARCKLLGLKVRFIRQLWKNRQAKQTRQIKELDDLRKAARVLTGRGSVNRRTAWLELDSAPLFVRFAPLPP
jgi:hypothetical protein